MYSFGDLQNLFSCSLLICGQLGMTRNGIHQVFLELLPTLRYGQHHAQLLYVKNTGSYKAALWPLSNPHEFIFLCSHFFPIAPIKDYKLTAMWFTF